MKRKRLSKGEKTLLLHCLKKHEPKLVEKVRDLDEGEIDSNTVNELRDTVGLELADEGFEPNWDPNEYGIKLKDLIDKLAELYLWPGRNANK